MGEAPVITWWISSIGYLPQGWGRHLCSQVPARERTGNPQATSFLPCRQFLLLSHPHTSYASKKLPFYSFQLLYLLFSQAARPLCSSWAPWNSVVNHLHCLPITSPHSFPPSFNNHWLRAKQWSSPELGMALREKHRPLTWRMKHSYWNTALKKLNGKTNCNWLQSKQCSYKYKGISRKRPQWKKISASYICDKGLVSKLYKELIQFGSKKPKKTQR